MPDAERRRRTVAVPLASDRRAILTTGDLAELTGMGDDFWLGEIHDGRLHAETTRRAGKRIVHRISPAALYTWCARSPQMRARIFDEDADLVEPSYPSRPI